MKNNYIVKSLEEISKEVCKSMPERNLKSKLLSTKGGPSILLNGFPATIGIYDTKGIWPFDAINEIYATMPLRKVGNTVAGYVPESGLADENILRRTGLRIYSLDNQILEAYQETIEQSDFKNYLEQAGIRVKLRNEEPKSFL